MRSLTVQAQGQRMLPVFAAAIGIIYNLPVDNLILSRTAANNIFIGKTVVWNDPLIQATNTGVDLPSEQIIRVVRSDKSGTTQSFDRALASFANVNNMWGVTNYWNFHPLQGSQLPTWPLAQLGLLNNSQCLLQHCSKSICQPGNYLNPPTDSCLPCAPGTYMDVSGQALRCELCPAGHFSDSPATPVCAKCSENAYQNMTGTTACIQCPPNTRRFLLIQVVGGNGTAVSGQRRGVSAGVVLQSVDSSATTIDDCKCLPGYWLPSSMDRPPHAPAPALVPSPPGTPVDLTAGYQSARGGQACVACPGGASCAGFVNNLQTIPTTQAAYWGDVNYPTLFYECKSDSDCSAGYYCGEGRMGTMCSEPLTGYFTVGGLWYFQCPASSASSAVLTVLLTIAVFYVWLMIMNLAEGSIYDSFDIGVKFLHLVGFIAQFPLRWHPNLNFVILILLVANLEVDFISPQCLWPSFNGVTAFYIQLAVPFIIVAVASAYWVLCRRLRPHGRITLQQAQDEPFLNRMNIRDGTVEAADCYTYSFNKALQVFGFMYQVLAFRSFSSFSCKAHPRGSFLSFFPDVNCGSPTHQTMMAIAVLYIVFVLLAMPAYMLWTLLHGRSNNLLLRPEFSQRYGTFYEQFKVDYVWWEIAILARKLCISIILALVEVPMIQGALAVLLIYIFLIAHVTAQPLKVGCCPAPPPSPPFESGFKM